MSVFYFPAIPLLRSWSNRAHFSWLCHGAPPSRTIFFFHLCPSSAIQTSSLHWTSPGPPLCISPEVMETSCPKYIFLISRIKFLQLLQVATWGSNTVLYPSYGYVGKLYTVYLPFSQFSFLLLKAHALCACTVPPAQPQQRFLRITV